MLRRSTIIAALGAAALSTTAAFAEDAVKPLKSAQEQTIQDQGLTGEAKAKAEKPSDPAAEKKVKEIVEKSGKVEDGAVQPATGRAEPVETWAGCSPETDKPENTHCDPALTDNPNKPDTEEAREEGSTGEKPEPVAN